MCGIAGFVGAGDRNDLALMAHAIKHRGPDGTGVHIDDENHVFLAHQRLAIVDIEGGAQPMWNEERDVSVVFNGEIYNHIELRTELKAKGYRFLSDHSDTEVLVHGWMEWGNELPIKLNGMFAFSIWDLKKKTIFLARDRYGEKPLFWGYQKNTFFFASELSAFTAHRKFDAHVSNLALKKYFAHGFIPSPNSYYQDAFKLQPGHWLCFDVKSVKVEISPYWKFRIEPVETPPSLEVAAEELQALLLQSVERHLMSDVPLGVFLSGGVDSSFAAAAMCQFMPPSEVSSFSIGFNEKSFDESSYAQSMSDFLGTTHHKSILDMGLARDLIGDVLSKLDEPMADASLLPTYLLSQFTRSKVTVALTGDGGDELFAGYDPFSALALSNIYKKIIPDSIHKGIRRLAEFLPKSSANMSFDFKVRKGLMGLDYESDLWNPVWLAPLKVSDIADLFNESVHVEDLYSEVLALWHEDPTKSLTDKTLEFYSNYYLPDDILTKVDRAGMMNGLEARSVFLDNDVVEFARKMPAEYKFDGRNRKKILKMACKGLVPDSILDRSKKGFGVPIKNWLTSLPLSGEGASLVGLSQPKVQVKIKDHQAEKADHRLFLWSWNVLQAGKFL